MALWGNNDNVTSAGTVSLNYGTGVVTGNASCKFGDAGSAQEGDVIRFTKAGVYFGDAVIKSIASNTSLTIGSTNGLSGAAISASGFTITQLPKYTIGDPSFREANPNGTDEYVFAVGDATIDTGTAYETGAGWVGVQTYMDTNGSLRVKKEILVAMSGITTGNAPIYPSNPPSN
jgi:hypothetical protein|tara:strand:- start:578 stop:1102 length:525 start_codon:yes stop_codon:yes gene_type:complete